MRVAGLLIAVLALAACSSSNGGQLKSDPMATRAIAGTAGPDTSTCTSCAGAPDASTEVLRRLKLDAGADAATVVASAVSSAQAAGWTVDASRTMALQAILTKPGLLLAVYIEDDSPADTPGTGPYDLDVDLSKS